MQATRARYRALVAVVGGIALAVVAGATVLWPRDELPKAAASGQADPTRLVSATLTKVARVECDEDVLASLPLKARHIRQPRRKIRLLDTPSGSLVTEWAKTPEQATDILHELVELHTVRMASLGHRGSFSTERVRKYHEDLVEALWPSNSIVALR